MNWAHEKTFRFYTAKNAIGNLQLKQWLPSAHLSTFKRDGLIPDSTQSIIAAKSVPALAAFYRSAGEHHCTYLQVISMCQLPMSHQLSREEEECMFLQ